MNGCASLRTVVSIRGGKHFGGGVRGINYNQKHPREKVGQKWFQRVAAGV